MAVTAISTITDLITIVCIAWLVYSGLVYLGKCDSYTYEKLNKIWSKYYWYWFPVFILLLIIEVALERWH